MSNIKTIGEKREELANLHNFKWGALRPIAEQMFSTQKTQLRAPISLEGVQLEDPETYGIFRNDTGAWLGSVGKDYETIEPMEFLRAIKLGYDKMNEKGANLKLEKIEYNELFGGRVINIKVPLKTFEFDNPVKTGDVTEAFMDFRTGFNGKIATSSAVFFRRVFCDNGCTSLIKGANRKYKHLKNSNLQAKAFATGMAKALPALETYEEMVLAMNDFKLSKGQVNELFEQITGYDVQEYLDDEMHYKRAETYENMMEAINEEFERTGRTAYGLFNGFTNYTNHYMNSGSRIEKEEGYLYKKGSLDLVKNAELVLGGLVTT
jgi:hypothetical protein